MVQNVKIFYLVIVFFLVTFVMQASNDMRFRWFDPQSHFHKEIDLRTGLLREEINPGVFKSVGLVKLIGVDLGVLPINYTFHFNISGSDVYFSVPGTGLVFVYKKDLQILKRIDNTFYRGFNFHSYAFMAKDTLHSIGGEGFWSTNSTLIYFDSIHKEWEKNVTLNKGPNSIEWDFVGYSKSSNSVFALEGKEEFANNKFDSKSVWQLDLNKNTWFKLGKINADLFYDKDQVAIFKFWLGDYFLYLDGFVSKAYLLDPKRNLVYEYKGPNSQISKGTNEFCPIDNQLFIFSSDKNGSYKDSITINELIKDSVQIGQMYIPEQEYYIEELLIFSGVLSVLVSIFLFIKVRRLQKQNRLFEKNIDINELPIHLIRVLNYFYQNGIDTCVSTNEMNEMLNIKSNSFETTRQKRSRDLNSINDYFFTNHRISDAIYRVNSEKDKRQMFYKLDEKAFQVLKEFKFGNQ